MAALPQSSKLGQESAGLAGGRRQFGLGAVRRVLLVDDLCDFEQQAAGGVRGDRVGEHVLHPIESADAVLLAKLEPRCAADIDNKVITAEPGTLAVLVH